MILKGCFRLVKLRKVDSVAAKKKPLREVNLTNITFGILFLARNNLIIYVLLKNVRTYYSNYVHTHTYVEAFPHL